MSVKMSNKSKSNNDVNEDGASSEGLLPSRCPLVSRMGLVSRMDPAVVKLLIGGQQEENGLQKKTE